MFSRTVVAFVMIGSLTLGMNVSGSCTWYCRNDIEAEYRLRMEPEADARYDCIVYWPFRNSFNFNDMYAGDTWVSQGRVGYTAYKAGACNENCWYPSGPLHLQDATSNVGTEEFEFLGSGFMPTGTCDQTS